MPTAYDRLPCITIIHHRSDRLLYGPILPYQIPDYLTTLPPNLQNPPMSVPLSVTPADFFTCYCETALITSNLFLLQNDSSDNRAFSFGDRSGNGRGSSVAG